jgi:hypothetical protein
MTKGQIVAVLVSLVARVHTETIRVSMIQLSILHNEAYGTLILTIFSSWLATALLTSVES